MSFTFRGKRSLSLRVWHWLNSGVIFALLVTVFLRDELVGVRENAKRVSDLLGSAATPDQAKDVARMYLERLWGWHVNLGLILGGLLLLRVVSELLSATGAGFYAKIAKSAAAARTDPSARTFLLVKLSHAIFYAVLTMVVATGITLAYGEGWGVPGPVRHALREVHEASMYAVIAFIVAHIVGVVRAEKTTDPGLVSDMINGG